MPSPIVPSFRSTLGGAANRPSKRSETDITNLPAALRKLAETGQAFANQPTSEELAKQRAKKFRDEQRLKRGRLRSIFAGVNAQTGPLGSSGLSGSLFEGNLLG